MSEDLYTRWLDVPPGPRPPHHYELLGVPLWTSAPEQIEAAAYRQLENLDQHAMHPDPTQREACSRLMNEVAQARTVLMDAKRRVAYDKVLAGTLSGSSTEKHTKTRHATQPNRQPAERASTADATDPTRVRPLNRVHRPPAASRYVMPAALLVVGVIAGGGSVAIYHAAPPMQAPDVMPAMEPDNLPESAAAHEPSDDVSAQIAELEDRLAQAHRERAALREQLRSRTDAPAATSAEPASDVPDQDDNDQSTIADLLAEARELNDPTDAGRVQRALMLVDEVLSQEPNHTEALQLQHTFNRYLGPAQGDVLEVEPGIRTIYIRPGSYVRGTPGGKGVHGTDQTQHEVTLNRGFYIGVTEVTQAQWLQVMGERRRPFRANSPVRELTWHEAMAFCRELSERTGHTVRLPTEAEWEYACRAGTTTPFSTGYVLRPTEGHFNDNLVAGSGQQRGSGPGAPHEVGSLPANPWGLHDMHGNVAEWCSDWLGDYPREALADPTGPLSGQYRVVRGGSFRSSSMLGASGVRDWAAPDERSDSIGFRIVIDGADIPGLVARREAEVEEYQQVTGALRTWIEQASDGGEPRSADAHALALKLANAARQQFGAERSNERPDLIARLALVYARCDATDEARRLFAAVVDAWKDELTQLMERTGGGLPTRSLMDPDRLDRMWDLALRSVIEGLTQTGNLDLLTAALEPIPPRHRLQLVRPAILQASRALSHDPIPVIALLRDLASDQPHTAALRDHMIQTILRTTDADRDTFLSIAADLDATARVSFLLAGARTFANREDMESAGALISEAQAQGPADDEPTPALLLQFAEAQQAANQRSAALATAREAAGMLRQDITTAASARAATLARLAVIYHELGQRPAATRAWADAVAVAETQEDSMPRANSLAQIASRQGQAGEVALALRTIARIADENRRDQSLATLATTLQRTNPRAELDAVLSAMDSTRQKTNTMLNLARQTQSDDPDRTMRWARRAAEQWQADAGSSHWEHTGLQVVRQLAGAGAFSDARSAALMMDGASRDRALAAAAGEAAAHAGLQASLPLLTLISSAPQQRSGWQNVVRALCRRDEPDQADTALRRGGNVLDGHVDSLHLLIAQAYFKLDQQSAGLSHLEAVRSSDAQMEAVEIAVRQAVRAFSVDALRVATEAADHGNIEFMLYLTAAELLASFEPSPDDTTKSEEHAN